MGEEGVALEHRVDRPLVGRQVGQVLAVQPDLALVGVLEAGDQAQQGGLAAAGGAQQGEELVLADVDRNIVQRDHAIIAAAENLGDALYFDGGLAAVGAVFSRNIVAQNTCPVPAAPTTGIFY